MDYTRDKEIVFNNVPSDETLPILTIALGSVYRRDCMEYIKVFNFLY